MVCRLSMCYTDKRLEEELLFPAEQWPCHAFPEHPCSLSWCPAELQVPEYEQSLHVLQWGHVSPRVGPGKCHRRTVQEGTRAALREGINFSCFHFYHPTVASRLLMWMMPETATLLFVSDHMAGAAFGKCRGITELLPCLLQAPALGAHRAVPGVYHYVPLCCAGSSTALVVQEEHCQGIFLVLLAALCRC